MLHFSHSLLICTTFDTFMLSVHGWEAVLSARLIMWIEDPDIKECMFKPDTP